jgi:hypothetical protein
MNIQKISPNYQLYTSQSSSFNQMNKHKPPSKNINFEGNLMNPVNTKIAEWIGKLAQTKAAEKLVNWTNKHEEHIRKHLFSHLIVLGSTLLSTFYIGKTIKNKEMDKDKRKTLAINQGATFIVSTIMAYTFDNKMNNITKNIIDKFKLVNKGAENLEKQAKGIDIAKKIIIFDVVYRFIAPVIVTPFANYFGNKLQEQKHPKI